MSDRRPLTKKIHVIVFNKSEKIFDNVFDKGPITIGRTSASNIPLDFNFISREHAEIIEESGKVYICDLKSSNGVRVGKEKISTYHIDHELEAKVGTLKFHIKIDQSSVIDIPVPTFAEGSVSKAKPIASVAPLTEQKPITPKTPVAAPATSPLTMNPAVMKPVQPKTVSTSLPTSVKSSAPKSHGRNPILARDFKPDLTSLHPEIAQSKSRRIEAVVTWHDQIYDVKEFFDGDLVTIGPRGVANVSVPILNERWSLARVGFDETRCVIPQSGQIVLQRDGNNFAMGDLIASNSVVNADFGYQLKIHPNEVAHVDFGSGMQVHLRYIPGSKPLTNSKMIEPEEALRQSIISSVVLHAMMVLIMWIAAPDEKAAPKLKNVSERYARLLIQKPKPKPTPIPVKPKIEAKKEPPKPKKEVVQKPQPVPKKIAKINKYPIEVQHPMPKAPPPVKVEALGALAALGAISKSAPSNQVTNININPNAGGMPSPKSMGGIVGALPSATGKLVAGGSGNVKTKGMGFGTGTGYGVQGLKGTAGGRGVAGAVVGEPKLAQSARPEGLSRAQVMAIVQKYLGEVQHCYERNLLTDPGLSGRMEFEWDISANGSVSAVRVKRSTVNNGDNLGECVKGIFAGMRFPRATNGMTTTPSIGFPFGRL